MRPLATFSVATPLPEALTDLRALSYNLWWSWNPRAVGLFRRLGYDLWEEAGHNPVRALGMLGRDKLQALAADESLLAELRRVREDLNAYLSAPTWFQRAHPDASNLLVAYFSLEFGITESLPIYSGGLGVLSGDHLKSASDLGLPLVGVGLLYGEGYFRQILNADGWQGETYPRNDPYAMPVLPVTDKDGAQVRFQIGLAGEQIHVRVWHVQVGRVSLFLLDTQVPENTPQGREVTGRLYGGDVETRIRQEVVLGVGGLRALALLGIAPAVCHLNEGHAAFLGLERIRLLMAAHKLTFAEAREVVMAGTVFTTHTPVAAGHDRFSRGLIEKYFADYLKGLGVTVDALMNLGSEDGSGQVGDLVTTALALRLAGSRNGVSRLHGAVTRRMWHRLWPDVHVDEVAIDHVTNGVHVRTWISRDMAALYDSFLGPRWVTDPADQAVWERVKEIPAIELWGVHERRRERLIAFVQRRLRAQLVARGAPDAEVAKVSYLLNPEALTIGFGRRFASYKRAGLVIRDPDRLERILCDPRRPAQLIVAGKAHPRDDEGKQLIQRVVKLSREPRFQRHIVFLENYDLDAARYLAQGCDLWLNNPRRPLEASGTSGMKAAANGVLNLSVLDGWWDEAYKPGIGWAIGSREETGSSGADDEHDAAVLYDTLENSVVPLFYDRTPDMVPHRWIEMMKASIAALAPHFNTARMIREYCDRYYVPALRRTADLLAGDCARVRGLAWWKGHVSHHWAALRIAKVETDLKGEMDDGASFHVSAWVETGQILAKDVIVQVYEGRLNALDEITEPQIVTMERLPTGAPDRQQFAAEVTCLGGGRHGYNVRVLPYHADLDNPLAMGLVRWA